MAEGLDDVILEGPNSVIRSVRRAARGFRNAGCFGTMTFAVSSIHGYASVAITSDVYASAGASANQAAAETIDEAMECRLSPQGMGRLA
ncbi:hypothetical protein I3I95_08660 [bacterium]|nr:hypothetical protein [bacterium]